MRTAKYRPTKRLFHISLAIGIVASIGQALASKVNQENSESARVSRYLIAETHIPKTQLWTLSSVIDFDASQYANVNMAINALLGKAGYRLHDSAYVEPFKTILELPVPEIHTTFHQSQIHEIIYALMGPPYLLLIDPVSRHVAFDIDENFTNIMEER